MWRRGKGFGRGGDGRSRRRRARPGLCPEVEESTDRWGQAVSVGGERVPYRFRNSSGVGCGPNLRPGRFGPLGPFLLFLFLFPFSFSDFYLFNIICKFVSKKFPKSSNIHYSVLNQ
jgi:hypothetical protein